MSQMLLETLISNSDELSADSLKAEIQKLLEKKLPNDSNIYSDFYDRIDYDTNKLLKIRAFLKLLYKELESLDDTQIVHYYTQESFKDEVKIYHNTSTDYQYLNSLNTTLTFLLKNRLIQKDSSLACLMKLVKKTLHFDQFENHSYFNIQPPVPNIKSPNDPRNIDDYNNYSR